MIPTNLSTFLGRSNIVPILHKYVELVLILWDAIENMFKREAEKLLEI